MDIKVKFSLEFPGATSGTIEALILHSLEAVAADGREAGYVWHGGDAQSRRREESGKDES